MKVRHDKYALSFSLGVCLSVVGCFQASGGTDSETHFFCYSDRDCLRFGPTAICVNSACRNQATVPSHVRQNTAAAVGHDASSGTPPLNRDSGHVERRDAGQGPGRDSVRDAGARLTDAAGGSAPDADGMADASRPVTLHGTLNGMTSNEGLRIAVVWTPYFYFTPSDIPTSRCADGTRDVSLELVEQPSVSHIDSNGNFDVTFSGPPPPRAHGDGSMEFGTTGELLVYRDGNDNGELDFVSPTESVDQVLGASDTQASFLLSDYPTTAYHLYYDLPPPGVSLMHVRNSDSMSILDYAPITTPIPIDLSGESRLQALLCTNLCQQPAGTCPAQPTDLPSGGVDWCSFGSTPQYSWNKVACNGCSCSRTECLYLLPNPLPPGWPCSAK